MSKEKAEHEESQQKTIVKDNFHPCKECDVKPAGLSCSCHLSEAWEKEKNQEYFYYQCQEKDCGINANGPKPCKLKTEIKSEGTFCIYSPTDKTVEWKEITKGQYDMIPTMRVHYFDGSYYTVRKDKPGWEYIIESLNRKKGAKFLLKTSREEQLRILRNVDLLKIEEIEMTEEDYMKIPASPDIAKIQVELKDV